MRDDPIPGRQDYTQADLIRVRDRALAGSSRAEAEGNSILAARLFEMAMVRDAWLEEKIALGEP